MAATFSKLASEGATPRHARIHCSSSSAGRGRVCGGGWKACIFAFGMSRGPRPEKSARIFPPSPTKRSPSSGIGSPSSSSSRGFGGRRPPSYQWSATGGMPARAGNSQRMSEACG